MDTTVQHTEITIVLINVHGVDIAHVYKCMCVCVHVSDTTLLLPQLLSTVIIWTVMIGRTAVSRWIPSGWVCLAYQQSHSMKVEDLKQEIHWCLCTSVCGLDDGGLLAHPSIVFSMIVTL